MIEFWKHSLLVAVTSKHIAQKSGGESADNCFAGFFLKPDTRHLKPFHT